MKSNIHGFLSCCTVMTTSYRGRYLTNVALSYCACSYWRWSSHHPLKHLNWS